MTDRNRPAQDATDEPQMNPAVINELAAALEQEGALVHELREALARQRAAVAASDPAQVNAGTDAISRILIGLDDARARRARLLGSGTGEGPLPLDRIEQRLGRNLPPSLASARDSVRRAVAQVAFEVDINRTVLRHAVQNGEAFLQALFASGSNPDPSYAPPPGRGAPPQSGNSRGGVILDRKV